MAAVCGMRWFLVEVEAGVSPKVMGGEPIVFLTIDGDRGRMSVSLTIGEAERMLAHLTSAIKVSKCAHSPSA